MPLCFAALMCHAPIVLPAVAGPEAARCWATTRAMRELAARVVRSRPDRLVVVSPHSPRARDRFAAWVGPHRGDLVDFRAPQVAVTLPDAPELAQAAGLGAVRAPRSGWLDHGAMVPLAFVWDAGWRGPTAVISLPWEPADPGPLAHTLAALPGRTAVLASGDMSHRLIPGAPAGHHPRAADFDRAFVAALRGGDWAAALAAPWREEAAEDVVESTRLAMAAVPGPVGAEVLSYEGPWGVGYTEAVLYDPEPPLYAIARANLTNRLRGDAFTPPAGGPGPAGVFVTLEREGALRGCIGHIQPVCASLYEEIAQVAVAAALEDPRFPPLRVSELEGLHVEVSVLEPPQPVPEGQLLDPRIEGLILEWMGRRGVLLPALPGVNDPAEQDRIVRRKAGIPADAPARRWRFTVRKEASP